jgi:hypothetical protein
MSERTPMVIVYGCPRAGTTWLTKIFLHNAKNYEIERMGHWCPLHPCQSDNGLIGIARLLTVRRLAIVRIIRNPIQVIYSWRYTQQHAEDEMNCGIACYDDKRFLSVIVNEHWNTKRQLEQIQKEGWWKRPHKVSFLRVSYEDLLDGGRDLIFQFKRLRWPDADLLKGSIDRFHRNPVRHGRMEDGKAKEPIIDDEALGWFLDRGVREVQSDMGY